MARISPFRIDHYGRECCSCGFYKEWYDSRTKEFSFPKNRHSATGYASTCCKCRDEIARKRKEANREGNRAHMAEQHRASSKRSHMANRKRTDDGNEHYSWMNGDDDIYY